MRKNKKSIGSHALGNRTVIGIICIVAALAICFGIAPVVNKLRDGTTPTRVHQRLSQNNLRKRQISCETTAELSK